MSMEWTHKVRNFFGKFPDGVPKSGKRHLKQRKHKRLSWFYYATTELAFFPGSRNKQSSCTCVGLFQSTKLTNQAEMGNQTLLTMDSKIEIRVSSFFNNASEDNLRQS